MKGVASSPNQQDDLLNLLGYFPKPQIRVSLLSIPDPQVRVVEDGVPDG